MAAGRPADAILNVASRLLPPRSLAAQSRPALAVLPVIAFAAIGFAAWEAYVQLSDVRPQVLPAPSRVIREGWEFRDLLWTNTAPTLIETGIGFAISIGAATLFAALMDFSAPARRALYPTLVASQTLPLIVLAPLMIIWFGFGLTPKILLVVLFTFFPITVGWVDGFNSTETEATNLLRSMGANRWQIFWKLRLPNALPRFFSGLRMGITYAIGGAIFAEYAGARDGLGIFMLEQKNAFRTDLVLAAVLVAAAFSIALFLSTYIVERIAIPWYFATRRAQT